LGFAFCPETGKRAGGLGLFIFALWALGFGLGVWLWVQFSSAAVGSRDSDAMSKGCLGCLWFLRSTHHKPQGMSDKATAALGVKRQRAVAPTPTAQRTGLSQPAAEMT
jgi:hypothetical protein